MQPPARLAGPVCSIRTLGGGYQAENVPETRHGSSPLFRWLVSRAGGPAGTGERRGGEGRATRGGTTAPCGPPVPEQCSKTWIKHGSRVKGDVKGHVCEGKATNRARGSTN